MNDPRRRLDGSRYPHSGVDIAGKVGSDVVSALEGMKSIGIRVIYVYIDPHMLGVRFDNE